MGAKSWLRLSGGVVSISASLVDRSIPGVNTSVSMISKGGLISVTQTELKVFRLLPGLGFLKNYQSTSLSKLVGSRH